MTKREQIEFVESCLKNLKKSIMDNFGRDKIPEDWNGLELRLLLVHHAQKFESTRINRARKRIFKNHVLINNL